MENITAKDQSRYREVESVFRPLFDGETAGLLATVLVDAERRMTSKGGDDSLRRDRLAARRHLLRVIEQSRGLSATDHAVLTSAAGLLEHASVGERMRRALHAQATGEQNVLVALAEEVIPHERKATVRAKLLTALPKASEGLFANVTVDAIRTAVRRGRNTLERRHRRRGVFRGIGEVSVVDGSRTQPPPQESAPTWSLGSLPAATMSEHVERITWLRDQLQAGTTAGSRG